MPRKSVEQFMVAIEDYLEARDEYRKCVAGCEYSADYHCYGYREKYHDASDRVADALDALFKGFLANLSPVPVPGKTED